MGFDVRRGVGVSFALACACGPQDVPAEQEEPEQCEIEAPTLIAKPEAGWVRQQEYWVSLQPSPASGRLYMTWPGWPSEHVFAFVNLCGGTPQRLNPPELGIDMVVSTFYAHQDVVHGIDWDEGILYELDRLATPEVDAPVAVASLPHEANRVFSFPDGIVLLTAVEDGTGSEVAGIGAKRYVLREYNAERGGIVELDDRVVKFDISRDAAEPHRLLLLRDDGELRRHDVTTGADETLAEHVRTYVPSANGRYLLWQQMDDDGVEAVYLRDLVSDGEVHLTDNEFAAWDESPTDDGDWVWAGDDRFVGLRAPSGQLVRVYDTTTAEAIAVPAHTRASAGFPGGFSLRLDEPDDPVERHALWNPADGEVFTWFEGQPDGFMSLRRADSEIEYTIQNYYSEENQLWAVDRATGVTSLKVSRLGDGYRVLADGRLLTSLAPLYGPPDVPQTVVIVDPATDTATVLADNAEMGWTMVEEQTLYYVDNDAPEDGVWAVPVPPK